MLWVLAALLLVQAACACRRAASERRDVDRPAAVSLKRHLETGDRADLARAAALLDAGSPAGDRRSSVDARPEDQFLSTLIAYLSTPEGQRPEVFGRSLRAAALRELTANHNALAARLLDVLWFGVEADSDWNSDDAFAIVLFRCTNALRPEIQSEVIAFMGLTPGQVVADVGAGPGFYTFPLARAVGPSGRVLALEINDRMLDFLGRQAAEQRLDNVLPRRGQEHDIQVAEGSLDHAFMTQMFVDVEGSHALADRRQLFGSILRALRPGGSFTVCEPPAGQTADTTHEWLVAHLEAYGFCFAARPGPDSPLLRVPILCVRVTRP